MKQPTKSDPNGENPSATASTRPIHGSEQEAIASSADSTKTAAHIDKYKVPDKEDLARSLQALEGLPTKFSRSYLVPYTEHLLRLLEQGNSYRDLLQWLQRERKVKASLGTLHPFLKKARRARRRARRSHAVQKSNLLDVPGSTANVASPSPTHKPPADKPSGDGSKAREAIRAVKKLAASPEPSNDMPSFRLDLSKPLLSNPKSTNNLKTKSN